MDSGLWVQCSFTVCTVKKSFARKARPLMGPVCITVLGIHIIFLLYLFADFVLLPKAAYTI